MTSQAPCIHLMTSHDHYRARLLDSSNVDHGKRVSVILPLMGREEQVCSFLHSVPRIWVARSKKLKMPNLAISKLKKKTKSSKMKKGQIKAKFS